MNCVKKLHIGNFSSTTLKKKPYVYRENSFK